jgi:hypothetical protein
LQLLIPCCASCDGEEIGEGFTGQHRPDDSRGRGSVGVPRLPLVLGADAKGMVLLAVTFLVSTITLASGRSHVMQGAVHLVIFAAFLFLALVP